MNSCVVISFCLVLGLAGTQCQGICNGRPCVFRGQYCVAGSCRCPKGMRLMGNSCGYPPPLDAPKTPTEEEKKNSVLLEILNTNKNEWDGFVDARFRRYVADNLTHEYCMKNEGRCGLSHELENKMNTYFNGKYIGREAHRLPGYPKENGKDLQIAFYVLNPSVSKDVKVIPAKVVVEILDRALITKWIKTYLGEEKELGKIKVLPSSTPNSGTERSKSVNWIVPGFGIGAFASFIFLFICICCARDHPNAIRYGSVIFGVGFVACIIGMFIAIAVNGGSVYIYGFKVN